MNYVEKYIMCNGKPPIRILSGLEISEWKNMSSTTDSGLIDRVSDKTWNGMESIGVR